ncbi:trigger factor [soil metagenome]
MKSTVEPVEGNKVKVIVQVDEAEFEPSVAAAWKEIAKEVRLPGFRPGKAPRKLLEKQFGTDYARSEAIKNAVPEFYSRAVIEADVDVIAAPDLEITEGEETGPITFEAVVETRPEVQVAGYDGLRIEVPAPAASDEEIDEQIDRLRGQYGELTEVERAAADTDYVTIDIAGTQDGEEVDGLTADDYLYLVGSGMIATEFDEHLVGASAGDVLEFEADHPDPEQDTVQFRLEVKNVKERVLPELTDEWVADATEFETVDELREDTRTRLSASREGETRIAVRTNIGVELAKLVDIEAPEALVSSEMQARLQNLAMQLQGRGIQLQDYLQITGRDPESFTAELKEASEEAVKVDLALRAVVEAENLQASDEEVDEEIESLIVNADITLEDAREELQSGGQMSAVRSDVSKRKALEWLVERSEVVDTDGVEVPAELLALPEESHDHDHAGHDHDHDHAGHDHD